MLALVQLQADSVVSAKNPRDMVTCRATMISTALIITLTTPTVMKRSLLKLTPTANGAPTITQRVDLDILMTMITSTVMLPSHMLVIAHTDHSNTHQNTELSPSHHHAIRIYLKPPRDMLALVQLQADSVVSVKSPRDIVPCRATMISTLMTTTTPTTVAMVSRSMKSLLTTVYKSVKSLLTTVSRSVKNLLITVTVDRLPQRAYQDPLTPSRSLTEMQADRSETLVNPQEATVNSQLVTADKPKAMASSPISPAVSHPNMAEIPAEEAMEENPLMRPPHITPGGDHLTCCFKMILK